VKSTKVVNLGSVRDLFSEWEKVYDAIRSGKVSAFQLTLRDGDGRETIYLGGVYREDPRLALGAILKTSAARVAMEDPLLKTAT
jgi:hypothetical protein